MRTLLIASVIALAGCDYGDPNAKPLYGKDYGLPANCRAYVQVVIDEARKGTYTMTESLNALERNCGAFGTLWSYRPE